MKALILWTLLFQAQDDRELDKKKLLEKLAKGVDALLDLRDSSKRAWKDFTKFLDEKIGGSKKEAPAPKPEPAKKEAAFEYNAWEAWNSFGVDSSVEFECKTGDTKMNFTKTVAKKDADLIKLKTVTKMRIGESDNETPGEEEVRRDSTPANCATCGKTLKGHKGQDEKRSEKSLKIGDREVKCIVIELSGENCQGRVQPTTEMWYSREVPGWMVKYASEPFTMTVVKFEKK